MRLFELKYPSDVRNDFKRLLAYHGFTNISDNSKFASVWSHPKLSYVLKIFAAKDHCYKDFINICEKYPNIHFPKFKGKMMILTNKAYAIRMEKLQQLPDKQLFAAIGSITYMEQKFQRNQPGANEEEITFDCSVSDVKKCLEIYTDMRMEFELSNHFNRRNMAILNKLFEVFPDLKEAGDICRKFRRNDCSSDLHKYNVMFRGNIPVIIDPWAPDTSS